MTKQTKPPTLDAKIDVLLEQMTLPEKVALLSGRNAWQTMPNERLDIAPLSMTDGPHGVRADDAGMGRPVGPATSFPTGVSMAASWDPALIERVGVALAEETLGMACDVLLGPCVNIVRTPLAGRNFESYSEDPYLAGRIGVAWVRGLQSQHVGASLKHYACNNQEVERFRGSSVVDERTLREIYLPAFESVVKETRPWTVMCAYNRINGVYASEHDYLLNRILRDEWGFEGVVVSDWTANHTVTTSVKGGLDLEMPGPAKYYGQLLAEAVRIWQVEPEVVERAARRVLRMLAHAGKLGDPVPRPEGSVNTPEHQALARELAEASITLLKNEGDVLPLDVDALSSLAVIGPNAGEGRIGGGGSSYVEPLYRVSPLEGLEAALGDRVDIGYQQGCDNYTEPPLLDPELLTPPQGEGPGLWSTYYNNTKLEGEPAAEEFVPKLDFWWMNLPDGVTPEAFSARYEATLTAPESGRHVLKLLNVGIARLYLDGELLIESSAMHLLDDYRPINQEAAYVELEAGRTYELAVEFVKPALVDLQMLRLLFAPAPKPEADDRVERAVELAARADAAVVFGGMPRGFESEGHDRPDMALPGRQNELIRAVAAANPNTIVVLNCGSPVELPWIDEVSAVVLAYYPGQEGGRAVANVLTGAVNPSGKLPVTFPRRLEDNPTFINYPGYREVRYGEGIFVGYRYYDEKKVEPRFPFGHGLSYTTFAYSDPVVPAEVTLDEPVRVAVTVTNTGDHAGQEIVQLYVGDPEALLARPPKELKGFEKVSLEPGESTTIEFALDRRALSFYDPQKGAWVAEPGEFEVLVGSSSRDIRARATFTLTA